MKPVDENTVLYGCRRVCRSVNALDKPAFYDDRYYPALTDIFHIPNRTPGDRDTL